MNRSSMNAVRLYAPGGPEALVYERVPRPEPAAGEVLVRAHAIGVSMPEVLVRRGGYPWAPPLPAIPGIEMSGRVTEVGAAVSGLAIGDPVFISARELPERSGCYAEYIAVPARAAYRLPPELDLELAACLSNYQVAWHLLNTALCGARYESVLVWGAAGGVGSAAVQLARVAGKRVVAVVGSAAKAAFASEQGADSVLLHTEPDMNARLRAACGGRGVDLVLDAIGGARFARNFDFLEPLGLVVSYGALGGPPGPDTVTAMRRRTGDSLGLRNFSMHALDHVPAARKAAMDELVPLLAAGRIRPAIARRFALAEAAAAHALFESGSVAGKILLVPAPSG